MNKLRTRFGLTLSVVLLVATVLPILILYLLSASGLVEATYVAQGNDVRREGWPSEPPVATPTETDNSARLPWNGGNLGEAGRLATPWIDPETGERFLYLSFDPVTARWMTGIPSDLQRVVFTSPVFKFRIDLPAWLALGSLPLTGLLLGIFLSVRMSRSVTRPVTQLAEAARAISRRELGYRVHTKGSQELQDLAQTFNRMAEDLEHAEITRRNLMADVAHELRTPLAVLDGNLRAILDGVHAMNEEEIALLYEQTQHLNHLVDDLRELSLAEADQLPLNCQEVDLARLVNETVAHFELVAQEQGILLTAELDEPLIHPCLDENRIRQVLHNLLSNAFRHTPKGGKVEISAKRLAKYNDLKISVTDTGEGLSSEELPYIFERFYRAEETQSRERGGTGLGLAIVKAIVEAHGGRVSAASSGRNQGSTFSIILGGQSEP
jgi:signal transduction histidine kinase